MGIPWFSWCITIWHPLFMKLSNIGWTCTWNPMNEKNTWSKLWIYEVMVVWNNSIPSSHFVEFFCNWVTRKLTIISRHVDILCWKYFISWMWWLWLETLALSCHLLFFVYPVWSKDKTFRASFAKLKTCYYSFSWTCMSLKI